MLVEIGRKGDEGRGPCRKIHRVDRATGVVLGHPERRMAPPTDAPAHDRDQLPAPHPDITDDAEGTEVGDRVERAGGEDPLIDQRIAAEGVVKGVTARVEVERRGPGGPRDRSEAGEPASDGELEDLLS